MIWIHFWIKKKEGCFFIPTKNDWSLRICLTVNWEVGFWKQSTVKFYFYLVGVYSFGRLIPCNTLFGAYSFWTFYQWKNYFYFYFPYLFFYTSKTANLVAFYTVISLFSFTYIVSMDWDFSHSSIFKSNLTRIYNGSMSTHLKVYTISILGYFSLDLGEE